MSTGKTGEALLELDLSFPDRLLETFGFAYRIDQTHFLSLLLHYLARYLSVNLVLQQDIHKPHPSDRFPVSINERKFNDILQESLSFQKTLRCAAY